MFPLLRTLIRICFFKCGPEETPYGLRFLCFAFILNFTLTLASLMHVFPADDAWGVALVTTTVSGIGLYWLLKAKQLSSRFIQLYTAILGVDIIFIGLVELSHALIALNENLHNLLGVILFVWSWSVYLQLIRLGATIGFGMAALYAVTVEFMSVILVMIFIPDIADVLQSLPAS